MVKIVLAVVLLSVAWPLQAEKDYKYCFLNGYFMAFPQGSDLQQSISKKLRLRQFPADDPGCQSSFKVGADLGDKMSSRGTPKLNDKEQGILTDASDFSDAIENFIISGAGL